MCLLTSLVISNIETLPLPPNTAFRFASAFIILLLTLSCRPFFLMYCQSFLVTSVLGIGLSPTTKARALLIFMGFMNAALGFLFVLAFFTTFFFATFFTAFFFAAFFLAIRYLL